MDALKSRDKLMTKGAINRKSITWNVKDRMYIVWTLCLRDIGNNMIICSPSVHVAVCGCYTSPIMCPLYWCRIAPPWPLSSVLLVTSYPLTVSLQSDRGSPQLHTATTQSQHRPLSSDNCSRNDDRIAAQ